MKKLITIILLILLAGNGWGATYYIDPTCATPGNGASGVCAGGATDPFDQWSDVSWAAGNTYLQKSGTTASEAVSITTGGSVGNRVTIGIYGGVNNAIIDNGGLSANGLTLGSVNYVDISNISVNNFTGKNILFNNSTHDNTLTNCSSTGGGYAIYSGSTLYNYTISGFTATSNTPASGGAIYLAGTSSHDLVLEHFTVTPAANRGAYITPAYNLTLTDWQVVTTPSTGNPGIQISGLTSGYLRLSDIYLGVSRGGVAGGCNGMGLYLTAISGTQLTASNIYSQNNTSDGVRITSSTFSAGSTLKTFDLSANAGYGLNLTSVTNLAVGERTWPISRNIVSRNKSVGVWIDGTVGGAADVSIKGLEMGYNETDGLNTNGNIINLLPITYNWAHHNGKTGVSGAGDGFSSHGSDSVNYSYNSATNNVLTGFANVQTSTGMMNNNVIWGNGTQSNAYSIRAGAYITSTANPGWDMKNNIIGQNLAYGESASCDVLENTASHNTWSNNLFYPIDDAKFYAVESAPSTFITYTNAPAAVKTNAVKADPQFLSATDFRIQAGSPAINAGTFVPGVHDQAGAVDYCGTQFYTLTHPDIGACGTVKPTLLFGGTM